MKYLLLLFLFFANYLVSVSQSKLVPEGDSKISGVVIDDSNQNPIEFATVALALANTTAPVNGAICNEKGEFLISKVPIGTYDLTIDFLGYLSKVIRGVSIKNSKSDLNLGTIKLTFDAKVLKEVVVSGQKEVLEEKVDRLVYNAENDKTATGGDATDVLRRVPMLSVDLNGNLSLRGNQNITVLINNKPSSITAGSVADALKQIPAEEIKSVEVITSPSAKYDAEGSAGIINIITKKNNIEGLSFNVDGSAGYRGSNLRLGGGFRKGKVGFSLSTFSRFNYNVNGKFTNNQTTKDGAGNETLNQQQANTLSSRLFGNGQFGFDYEIDKKNLIVASVVYGVRNANELQDQFKTQTFNNSVLSNSSLKKINTVDGNINVDANLNYTHTFKPQQEISILTLYSQNNRNNDFVNASLNETDQSVLQRIKNLNKSFNKEFTIQADYSAPIGEKQLYELGIKSITRLVISDYKYLKAIGNSNDFQDYATSLSNSFRYNQNVLAGYLSYTYNSKIGYSFKVGTRYEYTNIKANFATEKAPITIPSYGVLVPSINISKKIKGGTLKLSYNRRIQRPSIQFLNPNLSAANALNASIGNPNLQPEYTNNYELAYSMYIKSSSINVSTFVRNTNNAIQSVRDVIGDTIRTSYKNIGQENAYGASVFLGINIEKKFSLNGGIDIYYATLRNNDPNPIYQASNQGWVAALRLFGSYSFGKDWGLQFFSFYRGIRVELQGTRGSFYIYSLSLAKSFLEKRASIGFGAEQFFNPVMYIKTNLVSPVIQQQSTDELHRLNFKINFSYRIGKLSTESTRKRRKSVKNDDLKDGGGGDVAPPN